MLADALTKQMSPEKLVAAISTNTWSLEQPIESIVKKRDKQRQRIAGRDQQTKGEEGAAGAATIERNTRGSNGK